MAVEPRGADSVDYHRIFESLQTPYLVLDRQMVIVAANDAYLAAIHERREAIVGHKAWEVFTRRGSAVRQVDQARDSIQRALESGRTDAVTLRYDLHRDGRDEEHYWSVLNIPVPSGDGAASYVIHQIEDITDFVNVQRENAAHRQTTEQLQTRERQLVSEMQRHARDLQFLNFQLRETHTQFELVLEGLGEAFFAIDNDWRVTYINAHGCRVLQRDRQDILGRPARELLSTAVWKAVSAKLRESAATRLPTMFEYHNPDTGRWSENRIYPAPVGYVIFSTDISERKRNEARLQETQARLRIAVQAAKLGFWELKLPSREVYFSPECRAQLGYAEDEDWPSDLTACAQRLHRDDAQAVHQCLENYIRGYDKEAELEYRLRHKDGTYRWIHAHFMPIAGPDGAVGRLVVTHLDITERRRAVEQMRHSAHHDPLTSLPNRALIYEFTEHLIARARRGGKELALLFMDLDRFKPINDLYGHKTGDKLLRKVARRLASCVRGQDLLGRLAGDEFVIVLPDIEHEEDAARVARNIIDAMRRPYTVDGYNLHISVSVGISVFPRDGATVDALIHTADGAMYQVKDRGRNDFQFYEQELSRKANRALEIESNLRRSVERDEFALFYQPIHDVVSGEVVSVEALLRWLPAAGKTDKPETFIPIAETTGLIRPIGEWVFREACRQHRFWIRQGLPPIPIAVNVSAIQFRQRSFFDDLARGLAESGVAPENLHIELTETAIMRDAADTVRTLYRLKDLGVKIAMDDFGTGYSSMSNLIQLPIDKLKVDKSFILNLHSRYARAILDTIVALGRTLNLKIVAEGVEDRHTFEQMRDCVDEAQGYYLCRPIPADDFARWYKSHRAAITKAEQRQLVV